MQATPLYLGQIVRCLNNKSRGRLGFVPEGEHRRSGRAVPFRDPVPRPKNLWPVTIAPPVTAGFDDGVGLARKHFVERFLSTGCIILMTIQGREFQNVNSHLLGRVSSNLLRCSINTSTSPTRAARLAPRRSMKSIKPE